MSSGPDATKLVAAGTWANANASPREREMSESAVAPAAHSGRSPVTVDAWYVLPAAFAASYSSGAVSYTHLTLPTKA